MLVGTSSPRDDHVTAFEQGMLLFRLLYRVRCNKPGSRYEQAAEVTRVQHVIMNAKNDSNGSSHATAQARRDMRAMLTRTVGTGRSRQRYSAAERGAYARRLSTRIA